MKTYAAIIPVTSEMINDQICTALEGGCNYWLGSFNLKTNANPADGRPWYNTPKLYEDAFEIECTPAVMGDFEPKMLTPELIERGLVFLGKNHTDTINEIVMRDGDAGTADLLLQACLFGEIVYG